jgi:hypothetical protein
MPLAGSVHHHYLMRPAAMAQVTFDFETFAKPAWQAEQLTPDKLLPGGARLIPAQFPRQDRVTFTLAAGAVTIGSARTITFTAPLTGAIPAGTVLDLGAGAESTRKMLTLPTGAAKGATSITDGVVAGAALAGGESGTYAGVGPRVIPSGTLVGRTFAERASNTGYGPAADSGDDEIFLTATVVIDADINPDVTLIRHDTLIYENKLPNWATMGSTQQGLIRARYDCIISA